MRAGPDMPSKTLAEYVANLAQAPLEFEPGTKFLYGGAGFETLGRIIETASGQPYEKFIEQRILQPLGMKDSFFFPTPEKYNRIVSAYKPQNGKLTRVEGSLNINWQTHGPEAYRAFVAEMRFARPSWGMLSTASDMAAFYQMMLNGGIYNSARIVSRASVEAMTAAHTGDLPTATVWFGSETYGLGWGIYGGRPNPGAVPLVSTGTYGHSGVRGTFGWVDPEKDLVGVFMIQQNRLHSEEPEAVLDTFLSMTYAAIADDVESRTKVPKTGTDPK